MRPAVRELPRRWLVPEVVQTSAMDCGPAALKCLLEGFDIHVSYGRLREACQTDVDGTSIDALEDIARRIGLDAEQTVVPYDHVLPPEGRTLPALMVVRLPSGLTHFVVVWRAHGLGGAFDLRGRVQVMDPGQGRRWLDVQDFFDELYIHAMPVPAEAWRDGFAAEEKFVDPLMRRMRHVGFGDPERLVREALTDPTWKGLASLDASVRLGTSLTRSRGLDVGREAARVTEGFFHAAHEALGRGDPFEHNPVPSRFWSAMPAGAADDGTDQVMLVGAVALSVKGMLAHAPASAHRRGVPVAAASEGAVAPLPAEVSAALFTDSPPPLRHLWNLLRADGLLAPGVVAAAVVVSAVAALAESVLFRALFELSRRVGTGPQRLGAVVAVVLFVATVASLEFPLQLALQRIGRHLENRLRAAFLEKIPRLGDRYFSSRPMFDMTDRSHAVQQLRVLPPLAGQLLRAVASLVFTTLGIVWLAPSLAAPALVAVAVSLALPVAMQRPVTELDLRFRNHAGALGRFYLDALLGLTAVRTHGAEKAIRREHESLLVEWARTARALLRTSVSLEGAEALVGMCLSLALLLGPFAEAVRSGSVLLLAYWALAIPALGAEVAGLARQYPDHRNVTLRLLEPLGALEDDTAVSVPPRTSTTPVHLAFEDVAVVAGGHTLLEGVSLEVPPGAHVAVVGSSGAGKSTFVGLLLGWHASANGRVLADGAPLTGAALAALRRDTAWVDPAVQLWNRSLLDNLRYGTPYGAGADFTDILREADLRGVLERLPDGMQTVLGESGALVSGGEGQRVRLARAFLRPSPRLVILDEPFRGLDREKRRELLARARDRWRESTLLCVTHDVSETLDFPRVLVVEGGRVVEDAPPRELAADPASRYRALLDAETALREGLWGATTWRRLRLEQGRLREAPREGGAP